MPATVTQSEGHEQGLFNTFAGYDDDEAHPLRVFVEVADCTQEISGPHTNHYQPRQPHLRDEGGRVIMTWRAPEWDLPSLPTDLVLSPQDSLYALEAEKRRQCDGCGKSQHYYCFNCLKVWIVEPASLCPCLKMNAHIFVVCFRPLIYLCCSIVSVRRPCKFLLHYINR